MGGCASKQNDGDDSSHLVISDGKVDLVNTNESLESKIEAEKKKMVFFEGSSSNYDLDDLLRSSAEVLGKGSCGTTYMVKLEDGKTVALKRLKFEVGKIEFDQQIEMIEKVGQHSNIIPLRAYFSSRTEKLLVHDYVTAGSLFSRLHGGREGEKLPLDWESLVRILLGAAKGIEHIHKAESGKFTHGNIKSSNVLLSDDLNGCISDFGFPPMMSFTPLPRLNAGYQAPETKRFQKISQKSDVYSFGVLLLELLTGKTPGQSPGCDEVVDLPRWLKSMVREEWTAEVFDVELMRHQNIEYLDQLLQIAMVCVSEVPNMRPDMGEVVKMIEDLRHTDILKQNDGDDSSHPVIPGGKVDLVTTKERRESKIETELKRMVFFEGSSSNYDLDVILRSPAEVLGTGSCGTTYMVKLEDGKTVVVKRLKNVVVRKTEFDQQIEMIGRVGQHSNIIPLRAYYSAKGDKILVYDYVTAGSLSSRLHGGREGEKLPLDWESLVRILLGAAKGIEHIHKAESGKFAHGNIKSSNVLLSDDLNGCISDFGFTPLMSFTPLPRLTAGCQAPETITFQKISQKSDVYSFGVLLLELLTGKTPGQSPECDEVVDLPRWLKSVVPKEWTAEVFDVELMRHQNIEHLDQLLQIAIVCVSEVPNMRPDMGEVVKMIEDLRHTDILKVQEQNDGDDSSRPVIPDGEVDLVTTKERRESEIEAEWKKMVFFEGSSSNYDIDVLLKSSAEVLGKGSCGTTYMVKLEDGKTVVVKRLKNVVVRKREFDQQIEMIRRVGQHSNIIPLRAYYFAKGEKLLVYDYVTAGSLSSRLHGGREGEKLPLDWESLVRILLGAAKGIEHIHKAENGKFTHGNIKSSNVLLSDDLNGCISDFGFTPLMSLTPLPRLNTSYQAPETKLFQKISQKSDVYDFGVLLLKLLIGKTPGQSPGCDEVVDLLRWLKLVVQEEWTADVFDVELMRHQNIEQLNQLRQIAMVCVSEVPNTRPDMGEVVKMIEDLRHTDNKKSQRRRSKSKAKETPTP